MTKRNLAIVTGFGCLPEQVLSIAEHRRMDFAHFSVKPLFALAASTLHSLGSRFGQHGNSRPINPFSFTDIECHLELAAIDQIFFTGYFPTDRSYQIRISDLLGRLDLISDDKFQIYFNNTDSSLPHSMRYFLSINDLLSDLNIKALLAHEIFPELNVNSGCESIAHPPDNVLSQLPDLIVNVGLAHSQTPQRTFRFAPSFIIDNGIVFPSEAAGTDELLRTYSRKSRKKIAPYLLKPPPFEFTPALDQPTIGPVTVELCRKAGLTGIVICAETTTVVDKAVTMQLIDDFGMYLYAIPFSQLRELYARHFSATWATDASIEP